MNSKTRILKNSIYLTSSSIIGRGLLFVIIFYMAVKMGSDNLGIYAFAQSLFVFGIFFSNLGMRFYGVREVLKDPDHYPKVISELFTLGLFMKLIIFTIFSCAIILLGFSREKTLICIIFLASIFPDIFIAPSNVMFNAKEMLGYTAAVDIITRGLYAVIALLIIEFRQSLIEIAFSNLFCYFFGSFLLLYYLTRHFPFPGFNFDLSRLYLRFKALLPFALINVFGIIFVGMDIIMLGIMRGDKAVGWYKIGILIPQEGMFLLRFVSFSILPVLTMHYLKSEEEMSNRVVKLCKFYMILLLPLALSVTFLAEKIIFLFFPHEYFRSSYALMILIWFLPVQFITSPFLLALQIADKQVIITKIAAVLAFLNIVLNAFFIFLIGGDLVTAGPALGTLVSTLVAFILIIRTYNKHIRKIDLLPIVYKPVLSVIISTLLFFLADKFMNNLLSAFFVVIFYFASLRFLGEFSFRHVIDFLKDLTGRE